MEINISITYFAIGAGKEHFHYQSLGVASKPCGYWL